MEEFNDSVNYEEAIRISWRALAFPREAERKLRQAVGEGVRMSVMMRAEYGPNDEFMMGRRWSIRPHGENCARQRTVTRPARAIQMRCSSQADYVQCRRSKYDGIMDR